MKYSVFLPIKEKSTRLPNKNFLPIAGKPLFRWVLDTLNSVDEVNEIFLDTDSSYLLNEFDLTNYKKVTLHERPLDLRPGETSMNLILEHCMPLIKNDDIIQTHVTNPLLKAQTVKDAIKSYEEKLNEGFDSLFTVSTWFKRFYYRGEPVNHDPKNLLPTQDLEPLYEENSILYIFSKEVFRKTKIRIGEKPVLFPMNMLEAVDIDYKEEFIMAEALLNSSII